MPINREASPCPDGTCCVNMETDAKGDVTGPDLATVGSDQSVILFRFFVDNSPVIKTVLFFSDKAKKMPINSFYYKAESFGLKNWRVQLNSELADPLTVYYTVEFDVGQISACWDPTLVIEPRTL